MIIAVYETPKFERAKFTMITPIDRDGKCLVIRPRDGLIQYEYPRPDYTKYYDSDEETWKLILGTIRNRILEMGLIPESTEKVIPIENRRDVYVPKLYKNILPYVHGYVGGRVVSLNELLNYISNEMPKRQFLSNRCLTPVYDEFVLSVGRPKFRRLAGNTRKNSFDIIDIEIVIRSSDADKEKVKEHKQEILEKTMNKIESSKSFQKYGIPTNFLRMYQFVLRHDGTIMISFDLKPITGSFEEEEK